MCLRISGRLENIFLENIVLVFIFWDFYFYLVWGRIYNILRIEKSILDDFDVWFCLWFLVIVLIVSVIYVNNCLIGNIFIFRILILNVVFEEGDEDDWAFNKVMFKIGKTKDN